MAYSLHKSDGSTLLVLNDGLINNDLTSLTFVGKNVTNYGDKQNENFLYLLENFASTSDPSNTIQGQIWFDSNTNVLRPRVWDGGSWRPLAIMQYATAPTSFTTGSIHQSVATNPGDFWFDSYKKQLYVSNGIGTDPTLIGPDSVLGFGQTKMLSTSTYDGVGTLHPIVAMIVNGEVISVFSTATFATTSTGLVTAASGFPLIYRGQTLKGYSTSSHYYTSPSDVAFFGKTIDLPGNYTQRSVLETISSPWEFDSGIQFGSTSSNYVTNQGINQLTVSSKLRTLLTTVGGGGTILVEAAAITPNTGISTTLGSETTPFTTAYITDINASTLNVTTVNSLFNNVSNITAQGVVDVTSGTFYSTTLNAGSNATTGTIVGNWILSSGSKLQATYADLAEYYEGDQEYESGTVLVFGGDKEVTNCSIDNDTRAAGIVTTNPAYVLNQEQTGIKVCLALAGRVPCKVFGAVRKGDLLTTSNIPGHAKKAFSPELGSIIGKALENKDSLDVGVIEVAVSRL
jgi:hypothetical protein